MNGSPASGRMQRPVPERAAGWLPPKSWRLEDDPPATGAIHADTAGDPPLLLLLDRRAPLPAAVRQQLAASLSPAERMRHAAYRLEADRERFLLGRGGLRRLLGGWLQLAPAAVPLARGRHGKPHCPGGPQFSVSHSGDLILLGLHPQRSLGVDVERLRPGRDWRAIGRRMLAPAEFERIESLPEVERPQAFLAAWCRLEARLKARGTGLVGLEPLRREPAIPTTADGPSGSAAAGHARDEPAATLNRSEAIWDVAVPHGYRAAAALAAPTAAEGPTDRSVWPQR